MVWDYHVQVCLVLLASLISSSCSVVIRVLASHSSPLNGPGGVFTSCESSEEVFFFLLQQLGGSTLWMLYEIGYQPHCT